MRFNKTQYQIDTINKIKKLRLINNFSQSQISSILGISAGQVGNIESLKYSHKYTLKQIFTITQFFNQKVENIFLSQDEAKLPKELIIPLLITKIIEYDG